MWPIPTIENNFVTFLYSPTNIVCSWMQHTNGKTLVCAYERHTLSSLELHNLTIFNPTHIKNIITNFLTKYDKHNAYISFIFDTSSLYEQWITSPSSTPTEASFTIKSSSAFLSGYQLIYHHEESNYVFYCYKIPRSIILQYQLIATSLRLNVLSLTTQTAALFDAYKALCNTPFRHSQCAIDMTQVHNNITALISSDALNKQLIIPSNVSLSEELPYLAAAYGQLPHKATADRPL